MDLKTLQDTPPWEWPSNAGKMFLGILRDRQADDSETLLAADLAAELTVMNDALADALLSIVGNVAEPEQLRAKAAISLGPVLELADEEEFDDPDDVPITEKTFRKSKQSLRKVYLDSGIPKLVLRRILEASARAPEEWHTGAIRDAYENEDQEWKLTAVFCMRWVRGFDKQILEALESADADIHYQAVHAAGNWEVDAAWPHVSALATSEGTNKPLRIPAIEALATIRSRQSIEILANLTQAEDEDIADAASEAKSMAEGFSDDELEGEEEEDDDEPGSGNHGTIQSTRLS
jgi:hypothetical protein